MNAFAEGAVVVMEAAGIVVILGGAVLATLDTLSGVLRRRLRKDEAFRRYRTGLGRSILLGLEFLIASDIIRTVALETSWESLLHLAGITLIRALLGILLEVEIEGRWPWTDRRAK